MAESSFPLQFLITDLASRSTLPWPVIHTGRYAVHHHSDLTVTHLNRDGLTLVLIGFAIDPHQPELSDRGLLERLSGEYSSPESVLCAAADFAGRWALLIESPERDILLHDACGLREVFYSDASHSEHFCASQASTASRFFALESDPEAVKGFLSSRYATSHPEYWWPGDSTRFRGVRCLLPNHYLDLRTRRSHRFAPGNLARAGSPRETAQQVAPLLTNLIAGVAHRFELALPLTAGYDSRMILAACRRANVTPFVYTLRFPGMRASHQDLQVPPRVTELFGWTHHMIDCPAVASPEFAARYKANVYPAHEKACAIAEGLEKAYPPGRCSLSGHSSEIARCRYHPTPRLEPVTAKDVAELNRIDPTPFVLARFDEWFQDARDGESESGVFPLDLFH